MLFIGRKQAIKTVEKFLDQVIEMKSDSPSKLLVIRGEAGMGKSRILLEIRDNRVKKTPLLSTNIIDLVSTENRTEFSLLEAICDSLGESNFKDFYTNLSEYRKEDLPDKIDRYNEVVEAFHEEIGLLAEKQPLLLMFDTFEIVQDTRLGNWFIEFLNELRGRIGVILAGRRAIFSPDETSSEPKTDSIILEPFSLSEAVALGKAMYEQRKKIFELDTNIVQTIHILGEGRPIRIALAYDWLLEDVNPIEIITVPPDEYNKRLVERVRKLPNDEFLTIMFMATIDRRLNVKMLSILTGWDHSKTEAVITDLKRFSFVKSVSGVIPLALHDEMLLLVNTYIDFPENFKVSACRSIVEKYYDPNLKLVEDPSATNLLATEKLHYLMRYDRQEALIYFDKRIQQTIGRFDFDHARGLLDEIESHELASRERRIVNLNRAELLLREYQPGEAKTILDTIISEFDPSTDTDYLIRGLEGLSQCVTNGCTIVTTNVSEALETLEQALEISTKKDHDKRIPAILRKKGDALELLGKFEQAEDAYSKSLKHARELGNVQEVTSTLDQTAALYRKQNRPTEALELLNESLKLKKDSNNLGGVAQTNYLIGVVHRDLTEYEKAMTHFEKAVGIFKQVNDDLWLTKVYGDIAWLKYLDDELDEAWEYAMKSQKMAEEHSFGREKAENLHTMYHVTIDQGELEEAVNLLEQDIELSRKYANTYILVDCLHHLAEAAFEQKNWEKLQETVDEIETIVNDGFSAHVWMGRSRNIVGDMYFFEEDYEEALAAWKGGFSTIAIHGKGKAGMVVPFEQQLSGRREKVVKVLETLGPETIIATMDFWKSKKLDEEYPLFIEICEEAQAKVSKQSDGAS